MARLRLCWSQIKLTVNIQRKKSTGRVHSINSQFFPWPLLSKIQSQPRCRYYTTGSCNHRKRRVEGSKSMTGFVRKKLDKTHTLGPTQLLSAFQIQLSNIDPKLLFSYFGMHQRGIEILRLIKAKRLLLWLNGYNYLLASGRYFHPQNIRSRIYSPLSSCSAYSSTGIYQTIIPHVAFH